MATITRRESGGWQVKIRRRGHPAESKTFATRAAAEAWARAVERDIDRGAYISAATAERVTFDELAADFERDFAPHHYRGAAWRHKLARLRERLGKYALVAITPQLVARYRDERLQDPDPRYKDAAAAPRVSPATVKTEIDLLSRVLRFATHERGIALPGGNPVAGVRKPAGGRPRDRRLTADEWARLLDECSRSRNPWLRPAVLLSVETAMRQGELLALRWCDVDIKRRIALLHETKNGEPRAVPLTSAAVAVLSALPRDISGRVIPQDRMTLYHAFGHACRRAGIDDYTWHDLRHESLSRLAERGDLSVLELAAVSGHKTLQMLKRYTHLRAEDLARKLG
jgi:integrase